MTIVRPYGEKDPRAKWECQTCGHITEAHPDCQLTSRPARFNCRGCGDSDEAPIRTFKYVDGPQTREKMAEIKAELCPICGVDMCAEAYLELHLEWIHGFTSDNDKSSNRT